LFYAFLSPPNTLGRDTDPITGQNALFVMTISVINYCNMLYDWVYLLCIKGVKNCVRNEC